MQPAPLSIAIVDLARRAPHRSDRSRRATQPRHDEREKPPSSRAFGLTDRETWGAARLLSEGKTNAEVGGAMFISSKTAGVHISRPGQAGPMRGWERPAWRRRARWHSLDCACTVAVSVHAQQNRQTQDHLLETSQVAGLMSASVQRELCNR